MKAKRKPTKPVKAWAYVDRETGVIDVQMPWATRAYVRNRPITRPEWEWRIARVEIREVGR